MNAEQSHLPMIKMRIIPHGYQLAIFRLISSVYLRTINHPLHLAVDSRMHTVFANTRELQSPRSISLRRFWINDLSPRNDDHRGHTVLRRWDSARQYHHIKQQQRYNTHQPSSSIVRVKRPWALPGKQPAQPELVLRMLHICPSYLPQFDNCAILWHTSLICWSIVHFRLII